jgi:hypothetical protein
VYNRDKIFKYVKWKVPVCWNVKNWQNNIYIYNRPFEHFQLYFKIIRFLYELFPFNEYTPQWKTWRCKTICEFSSCFKIILCLFLQESNIYKWLEIILIFIVLSVALAKSVPFSLIGWNGSMMNNFIIRTVWRYQKGNQNP